MPYRLRTCLLFLLSIVWIMSASLTTAQDIFKTPQELADVDGQFIDVSGTEIYFIARGPENGPAVLLIHGFGGSTFTWRDNMDAIAQAGFYVVALDLPPFGLSDKDPELDFSRSWMADTIAGFMDEIGLESATLVGHSMGGGVIAQFAVRHPEKVDRLVFVAGGIGNLQELLENDAEAAESENRTTPMSFLSRIDPKSPFAAAMLRNLLTPDAFTDILKSAYYREDVVTDEVAAGYQRPLAIENWPAGFLAYQVAEEQNPITLDDLIEATAEIPILIIWGEQDPWVSIRLGEQMRDALAQVRWVTYPNIGHLPMEENTGQFNIDLLTFLREQ